MVEKNGGSRCVTPMTGKSGGFCFGSWEFRELVEHHIKDEQSKVFKSAEKALSSEEFKKIMKQFEQEKLAIKKTLK